MPKANLTATKEEGQGFTTVFLSGVLDEHVDFFDLLGPPPKGVLVVNCRKIKRMNSSGSVFWKNYFEAAREKGTELRFADFPPNMIEYANFIGGFLSGGKIESIMAYFYCKKCAREYLTRLEVLDADALRARLGSEKCPTCFSPVILDEFPKSFFSFMGEDFVRKLE